MSDQNLPEPENGLIIRPSTGLLESADGGSSAISEIINRSLIHIQTSKALTVTVRRAGEEQEFEIAPGVKIVMCWIPPGEFLMGSPEDELGRLPSETQHRVTITQGFWLAKTQTTQAQWEAVMGSNPSKFNGSNLPVETVSWNDISEPGGFMEKINRFTAAGEIFFLPTDAQWEYACRAGTTTALNSEKNLISSNRACPNLDEVAWYWENSGEVTHPVSQKKANAWGLHDMHGNVCEWCTDWHEYYADKPLVDPRGPSSGSFRICRGGTWYDRAYSCRAAYRNCHYPSDSTHDTGFRVARSSVSGALSGRNERTEPVEESANTIQVHTHKTLSRLHRIGDHELQWPDYQLVCFWAEQLNTSPAKVLVALFEPLQLYARNYQTTLVGGRFVRMVLGRNLQGIKGLPSIEGLRIKLLTAYNLELCTLEINALPHLTSLRCIGNKLTALDLSSVPNLTELWCQENRLTELDLSSVPNLTELWCHENKLTRLDLSSVSNLTELWCHENKLTRLDLSSVPNLTQILCDTNRLNALDLSLVPNLRELCCSENKLTKLDLSSVPKLGYLSCMENKLTKLDLSSVRNLTELFCSKNKLTNLDLSSVANLIRLWCSRNKLTKLDLSSVMNLTELECDENKLTALDLSSVPNLTKLWCGDNQMPELDIRPSQCLKSLICFPARPIQRPDQNFK